jgi:polyferredoxin
MELLLLLLYILLFILFLPVLIAIVAFFVYLFGGMAVYLVLLPVVMWQDIIEWCRDKISKVKQK